MEAKRSYRLHYFLRAIILTGFTLYIIRLVKTDRMQYYIAPRMMLYVKLAAIAFMVLAVYQVYLALQPRQSTDSCGCEHVPPRSPLLNLVIYTLFVLPLALGFLLPDALMGSSIASIKGMNLNINGSQTVQAAAARKPPAETARSVKPPLRRDISDEELARKFPSDEYTEDFAKLGMLLYRKDLIRIKETGFLELLESIDLYKRNFIGKKIQITGFVYRESPMDARQFAVSRLAMQCCSADALPYGVMVESSLTKSFPKDTWVRITGTIGMTNYNHHDIMKIDAENIEKVKASATPYVYPYFSDYAALAK